MENKELFFTTGELAKLTGLSKQLLIFYDKKNFFTASSTGVNGYRYYLLSKYFELKVLITLRKMDIPLEEIYQYLEHGDESTLKSIYTRKLQEYARQIDILKEKSAILTQRLSQMNKQEEIRLNQVFITEVTEEKKYYKWNIHMNEPVKKRISKIALALRPYLQDENCLYDSIQGYILDTTTLNEKYPAKTYSFLTRPLDMTTALPQHEEFTMKPGVYLKIHGYGHYGVISNETKELLSNFIRINHMKPASHILVFPFNQYWMCKNNNWVMTAMLRVKT